MSRACEPSLVLGIDTGGTYTDGVLLDYDSGRLLATHKSLTTRRDLSIGIGQVIESIHLEDPSAVKMVCISTTLATNAIAEGRGRRVALFLIGYDPELIATFKMADRFATPRYYFFAGGHDLYGREKEALDLPAILAKADEVRDQVDAIAVSSYFSPLNPEHEHRVFEAISGVCGLPIVLGHQLSTRLGSVERATTAALNASLLAVLRDFVVAVRRAMACRQIDAPLMVVRGDGTLMSAEFAARAPVETIHSGPAASAIGGRFLSQLDDALVVDVGGTTTDIALIQAGQVAAAEEGARVGGYKTCVKAANLLSIALGGDSRIDMDSEQGITVGPERVTPLACLASQYPQVKQQLRALSRQTGVSPEWLEYWYLLREPPASLLAGPHTRELIAALRGGPMRVPEILERLGLLRTTQLDAGSLLRQEVIAQAALTPTDLMHIEGRYNAWDAEASQLAWQVFCRYHFRPADEMRAQVWRRINEMIVQAIVTFLSGKALALGRGGQKTDADLAHWFFYNALYDTHPQLETSFRLRQPIIGIGAPAGIFLPPVARTLHTELVLPEHHGVANAVGAAAGNVMVTEELLVCPLLSRSGLEVLGYYVQGDGERHEFDALEPALAHARALSKERALAAAVRSGAANPQVTIEELADGLDTFRLRARAVGKPRLAGAPRDRLDRGG